MGLTKALLSPQQLPFLLVVVAVVPQRKQSFPQHSLGLVVVAVSIIVSIVSTTVMVLAPDLSCSCLRLS
ncbi:hypothetical protein I79_007046 [Cricetulus griseus]|uniref:Uncharacterized protein n=1 Tax=Cricetulus griseus TaxID=10029 RepID=G3H9H4_CRIGR|nr:hypothetical protein I79_007046 [Cricetulus griseus]